MLSLDSDMTEVEIQMIFNEDDAGDADDGKGEKAQGGDAAGEVDRAYCYADDSKKDGGEDSGSVGPVNYAKLLAGDGEASCRSRDYLSSAASSCSQSLGSLYASSAGSKSCGSLYGAEAESDSEENGDNSKEEEDESGEVSKESAPSQVRLHPLRARRRRRGRRKQETKPESPSRSPSTAASRSGSRRCAPRARRTPPLRMIRSQKRKTKKLLLKKAGTPEQRRNPPARGQHVRSKTK